MLRFWDWLYFWLKVKLMGEQAWYIINWRESSCSILGRRTARFHTSPSWAQKRNTVKELIKVELSDYKMGKVFLRPWFMNLLTNTLRGVSLKCNYKSVHFFIIPVIILPNFLTAWKRPPLLSGLSILTLGITRNWQKIITLPPLKINLHRINPAVAGGSFFD